MSDKIPKGKNILLKGNEALAEAAIIAGCRYYFGYPITPQNEIPNYMSRRMPEVGGTFVQAESELAAIGMVMGAAAGGVRTMCTTSSPGMSLKQEGISYLAGSELPCVIVNIMRGGPGLGGIGGSQADYFQATRGGGNGDYRTIVLSPGSGQELADFAIDAFDLADEYRNPVIILADGFLGQMSESVIMPQPSNKSFDKPWAVTGAKGRSKNVIASMRLVPDTALEEHNHHLHEKYKNIIRNVRRYELYKAEDAEWMIVAYGTSARVARKSVNRLREKGIRVGLFRPLCLWPFPDKELLEVCRNSGKLLVVEMSMGQMLEDVKLSVQGAVDVDFYGRAGGTLPSVEDITRKVENYEREGGAHVQAS